MGVVENAAFFLLILDGFRAKVAVPNFLMQINYFKQSVIIPIKRKINIVFAPK